MLDFLMANIDSVIFVLGVLIVLAVLIKRGYKNYAYDILFFFVTKAESEFGGGTGLLKKAAVITWLYEKLPVIVRLLFTKDQISNLVEEAVERMKKYLAENVKASGLVTGTVEVAK